jgi:reverse gyrase
MTRGYCVACGGGYAAEQVEDGLCSACLALQPTNDPGPYADEPPRKYSKAGMRERLGVSGDEDV